jgi:hypothetical protein
MTRDAEDDVTVKRDDADLRDEACPSCQDTRVVRDADSGESGSCPLCASPACATTIEIDVPTPEVVSRSVGGELDGRRSMLSPMASLSRWARDYLEAESALRRVQTRVLEGDLSVRVLGDAIRRAAFAELTLRQATGASDSLDLAGLERERLEMLQALVDPSSDRARSSMLVQGAPESAPESASDGDAVPVGWFRRALGRLLRGSEPSR